MASYRIRRLFFLEEFKKYTAPMTLVTNIMLKKTVYICILCMIYNEKQAYSGFCTRHQHWATGPWHGNIGSRIEQDPIRSTF